MRQLMLCKGGVAENSPTKSSVIFSGIVPILIEQISEMSVALKNYLNDFLGGQTAGGEFFQKFWPSFSDEFTMTLPQ